MSDSQSLKEMLPVNTVHCFPARKSLILRRRVISGILGAGFLCGAVFFLQPGSFSIGLSAFAAIGLIGSILVFAQSFLIASYRVALDYEMNEVVLRYQFQKIRIPFDDFDTRDGQPDQAASLLSKLSAGGKKDAVRYLILDNVRESACYQTTSKDLDGTEDFSKLKAEAENIRDAYRGKPDSPVEPETDEDEMTKIIRSARSDQSKDIDETGNKIIQ